MSMSARGIALIDLFHLHLSELNMTAALPHKELSFFLILSLISVAAAAEYLT